MSCDLYPADDPAFTRGDRVSLHHGTIEYERGARFGTVLATAPDGRVRVQIDGLRRPHPFHPGLLRRI